MKGLFLFSARARAVECRDSGALLTLILKLGRKNSKTLKATPAVALEIIYLAFHFLLK
jgi:hypothetical protein